jgi:type I restriction enzyme S subunit
MNSALAWQSVVLRDLCEVVQYGYTASATDKPVGPKFLRITDIVPETIDWSCVPYCEIDPQKLDKYLLRRGDIVIARTGATTGYAKYIRNAPEVVFASYLVRIRLRDNVDNRYAGYVVESSDYKRFIQATWGGAAQPNANAQVLTSYEMPLPPLPTQHKIASILSAYDNLIENNLRRINILEEMAQNLYREWFVKFRFPGHEKVQMVDSPLGKIPEGWEVKTVGDTFGILGGGTPSKKIEEYWAEGDIMWYVPSDLTASKTMFMDRSGTQITELGLTESSAQLFPPFSVMMTSRATLGVIAINTTEASTNQGFITCLPNERLPLYNLYHWLMENVEIFIGLASGATFKEITKGVFKTIKMVVPDKNIARVFEDNIEPLAEYVLNLQRKNENLRRTRDLLLPKLISGELDVSNLDIKTGGHMQ